MIPSDRAASGLDDTQLVSPFILTTFWGSWVGLDPLTGRLVHQSPDEGPVNLVFEVVDDGLRVHRGMSASTDRLSQAGLELDDLEVEWSAGRTRLALRHTGLYASAEPDGHVSICKLSAGGWELFTPLDAGKAIEIRAAIKRRSVPDVPRLRQSQTIPKLIHQICFTNDNVNGVPDFITESTAQVREMNPDYAYRLWTDKNAHDFIYDAYGYSILNRFLRISHRYGACRADLFRYLCLYKQGGVYLDIKSTTERPLSDIILDDDQFLLSQWDNTPGGKRIGYGLNGDVTDIPGGEYEQWHIIAAAGHPFLEYVITRVLGNIEAYDIGTHGVGKIGALRVTGPIAYTRAIHRIRHEHPHRVIRSEHDGLNYNGAGGGRHERSFKRHYSALTTPVVDS